MCGPTSTPCRDLERKENKMLFVHSSTSSGLGILFRPGISQKQPTHAATSQIKNGHVTKWKTQKYLKIYVGLQGITMTSLKIHYQIMDTDQTCQTNPMAATRRAALWGDSSQQQTEHHPSVPLPFLQVNADFCMPSRKHFFGLDILRLTIRFIKINQIQLRRKEDGPTAFHRNGSPSPANWNYASFATSHNPFLWQTALPFSMVFDSPHKDLYIAQHDSHSQKGGRTTRDAVKNSAVPVELILSSERKPSTRKKRGSKGTKHMYLAQMMASCGICANLSLDLNSFANAKHFETAYPSIKKCKLCQTQQGWVEGCK